MKLALYFHLPVHVHDIPTVNHAIRSWQDTGLMTHLDVLQIPCTFPLCLFFSHLLSQLILTWTLWSRCPALQGFSPRLSLPFGPPGKKSQLHGSWARTPACWPWRTLARQVWRWRPPERRFSKKPGMPVSVGERAAALNFVFLTLLHIAVGVFQEFQPLCLSCI